MGQKAHKRKIYPSIKTTSTSRKASIKKLLYSTRTLEKTDAKSLAISFAHHLKFSLAKDEYSATPLDCLKSLALTVRDRLVERWIETQQTYYEKDAKRIYYLSMEFLIGRSLSNSLINLDLQDSAEQALSELGYRLEDLQELEFDAALGNGGLGRLAACFMDSMATLELPGYGYGIRYDYGIFFQRIIDGYQQETPDNWLRYGNPWEIERPEYIYMVRFYGQVDQYVDTNGVLRTDWVDTENVIAMAYDTPIPGYRNNTVNNLRLWAAKASREFNLEYFNHGDYDRAVEEKIESENISKVLYPKDDFTQGRELRLKQEYFLVSATLQDIIRRYKKTHQQNFNLFSEKVAIQLNDTHPTLVITELMRILVDLEGLSWENAWEITVNTCGYTNHTILSEALEKWSVSLLGHVLPRHLQIIYEINRRFLEDVARLYGGDKDRLRRVSIIEEGTEKRVRMANLAIVGSHSVNGVAALHSEILKNEVFKDFYEMWPERFNNKTNGITPRRWLKLCNPALSALVSDKIGEEWISDLFELKKLTALADNQDFQKDWLEVKKKNKTRLAHYINKHYHIESDPDSIFDCQVKRIHEYKRQLLNALHIITLYNRIKNDPTIEMVPRTIIFAGKAAPGYFRAKLVIKLINSIAHVINNDPQIGNRLKVVFLANYSVSLAQKIIPAADLSEQISTAGMEASGTGNMKFALNGALTIGALDGANIEIMEEVGKDNIFIFGLTAEEVMGLKTSGYDPWLYYQESPELKQVIDMIGEGYFSPSNPNLFQPLLNAFFKDGDYFMVLADYAAYVKCQEQVTKEYLNQKVWIKKAILNVANMGKFSSDRTINEYAEEIWKAKPIPITLPQVK